MAAIRFLLSCSSYSRRLWVAVPQMRPRAAMFMRRDVPPKEMKGSGMPVTGNQPITMAMFTSPCTEIRRVRPYTRRAG